ncbi:uncharacterized protein C16orf86 homolog isoform X2 [Anolis carolinensis]|uniref:uncharacterized protein C16orf86 homolog isoform X2 n=1 Tax=Anolis carolinensis TaxID=28377 RepID=UPI000203A315|nr:PREDICTED: uncharacterized protein C16orf86 homolog isoform X2 [Anolis carolinensis]|eukprot:XP_016851710.1 PREDICTED: uncharacterized protein C16orf86 homolog isoform X2 [Anolis carolinensis]
MAAPARSPNEKKSSGGKASPPHFLLQLAAALDNSTIKSLQWHEDGRGILLHTKLYEEEIQRHQELFPEVKNLKSVSVLQAWLTTYGFKTRIIKTDSDILSFQHPDFKKLPSKAEEAVGPKAEVLLLPKQPKKSKKRKSISILDIPVAPSVNMGSVLPPESAGKSQRLRPLYQYINYDNPEMNSPPDKESDLPQVEVPPVLENKTGLLELRITPNIVADDKGKELRSSISATSATAAKTEVDKSTQVDIDKMLSVCAAHLVPPLSPQYK